MGLMVDETDTLVRLPVLGRLTYREWHHLVNGVGAGYRQRDAADPPRAARAYWNAGYLAGHTLRRWVD
jgi:hypothetical protein